MASQGSTAVVWFRRDLRLADNPALLEAAATHEHLVALFVHDPALIRPAGANRLAFLHASLDALGASLDGLLVERRGDPVSVVTRLAAEVEADVVYVAEDFGPYGGSRDALVEDALVGDGRVLERVGSPYAVPPGTVFTRAGDPFKVFTPYSRAWREHGWDEPRRAPTGALFLSGVASDPRPAASKPESSRLPEPGEAPASAHLDAFVRRHVDAYDERRDRPDLDATSRLSPYLRWGTLHPRQILHRLGGGAGATTFTTELCWRDFYADVLFHRPETARTNFAATMDALRWDTGPVADERFEAWCQGRTGYPIVDAGMRQLLAEGWMHNRVRMLVASFLVKDLHIHWRRGARWFMRHLVDGDLASNQHGWQWTAGTGTDAAPFFRVFNPVTQGRRFDPDGTYVRRYVEELAGVEGAAVHEPWKLGDGLFAGTGGYPDPIVDHATERKEALARFSAR